MHFVDTNIFLRFLAKDDHVKASNCRDILLAAAEGNTRLATTDLVFAELVWVLQSPKTYNLKPQEIYDLMLPLITIKNLFFPAKKHFPEIMELFVKSGIDFIDAYNAIIMKTQKIESLYSYDQDFDIVEGVSRVEPSKT